VNGQVIGTPVAGVTVPQRSYCQYRDAGAVCVGSHVDSSLLRPAPGVIMESWIAWLVLAALLGVAEVLTTTLAFGLLAVAALVAAIAGGAGLGLPIQRGEVWSARCYDESQVIPAGSAVDVFAIEGATALVHPRE